jgi:hypothetical protein
MIVAAVWSAALAGGILGVTALSEHASPAPVTRHVGEQFNAPRLGGRVPTSFGSFSVSAVNTLLGPARAMHLHSVPRGMRPIQLRLTINNIRQRSLAFDAGWFRVTGARGSHPVAWSSHVGTMGPLTAHGVLLRVLVPVGDRLPRLEYRDPTGRAPLQIDLGSARNLQTFNPATHQHGG